MSKPNVVCYIGKFLNLSIETIFVHKTFSIKSLDKINKFSNEIVFILTILDNYMFFDWNVFLVNRNIDCKWSII